MTSPLLTETQLIDELRKAKIDREPLIVNALKLVKLKRAHGGKMRLGGGSVLEEHIYPVTSLVLKLSTSPILLILREKPNPRGRMSIKAFIQDPKEISRICENLGLADWRAPPKMGMDKKYQEPENDEYLF